MKNKNMFHAYVKLRKSNKEISVCQKLRILTIKSHENTLISCFLSTISESISCFDANEFSSLQGYKIFLIFDETTYIRRARSIYLLQTLICCDWFCALYTF
jgi:hypothetical protein